MLIGFNKNIGLTIKLETWWTAWDFDGIWLGSLEFAVKS
jgi:hypothetical protein